jgi:hypothetical protein
MDASAELQEALAKHAISEIVHRFSIAVDSKSYDDLAELFDPQMDSPKWGQGPEGVKDYYLDGYRWAIAEGMIPPDFIETIDGRTLHTISNHQCDLIDDDHAIGLVYLRIFARGEDGPHEIAGIWVDEYVRRDGRWYIADRINAKLQVTSGESPNYDPETLRLEADPDWIALPAAWAIYREQRSRNRTGADYRPLIDFYEYRPRIGRSR